MGVGAPSGPQLGIQIGDGVWAGLEQGAAVPSAMHSASPCRCRSPTPQEFENPEGEDCSGEYTPPAEETSSSQSLPDVYILPLAEVSLPMPAPQPAHSGRALHPAQGPGGGCHGTGEGAGGVLAGGRGGTPWKWPRVPERLGGRPLPQARAQSCRQPMGGWRGVIGSWDTQGSD